MWRYYCSHLVSLHESHVDAADHSKFGSTKTRGVSSVTMVVPSVMKNSLLYIYINVCSKITNENCGLLGYHAVYIGI